MFLTVVDMTDADDTVALADSTPIGITVRAWYGVKLVSVSYMTKPKQLLILSQIGSVRVDSRKSLACRRHRHLKRQPRKI